MAIFSEGQKNKLYSNKGKIKKVYAGYEKIYSSGNIVTYHVDAEQIYTEEVDESASCLVPKTFTPVKNGWTFIGWSLKNGGDALNDLVMGENPIELYAVWVGNPWTLTPLNSVTWIFSQPNGPGEYKYAADTTEIRVFAKKTAGNYAFGRMSANIPTRGCRKCRIKYLINSGWDGGGGAISGISSEVRGEGYSYLSGLRDTVNIYIQAQDATAYFTCAAYIKEIYFYN